VPTKNCVRRDNGRQLHQGFSAECFPFDGQKASLGIGQYHSFLAQLLEECLDLGVLKLNDLLLPLIDPARQRDKHYVPGPQNETHGGHRMLDSKNSTARADKRREIKRPRCKNLMSRNS
jgi:hypothetical protein